MHSEGTIPSLGALIVVLVFATLDDVRWLDALIVALALLALALLFFLVSTPTIGDNDG